MPVLSNKKILIISPQYWGKMFVSKHHYAVELAKRNNTVYFLNPIDIKPTGRKERIKIHAVQAVPNLYYVEHRLWFPFQIKFHTPWVFHFLMKFHVKQLLNAMKVDFDIVWSFDLGDFIPLKFIPARLHVFHPVDEPMNSTAILSARGADILFSTTDEIRNKYRGYNIPSYKIQHGLSDEFLKSIEHNVTPGGRVRVGMSGNLTRKDIDRITLLKIVNSHPEIEFNLWGAFSSENTNIGGGEDIETQEFIQAMQKLPNVLFHGPVPTGILARELQAMDAFLICYLPGDDPERGTNYHKVLEYLSVGKVIISSYVTEYADKRALIEMPQERNNSSLFELFTNIINNLSSYNDKNRITQRRAYALDNTYHSQVNRMELLIEKHFNF
jgi:glycosyltransferase involved in cell wall biosynthesis